MKTESQDSAENMQEMENSFDKKRHIFGAILGPLCAIILWFLPINGLSDPAHHPGIHLVDNRTYIYPSHILAWSHTLCNAGRCAYERGLFKLCKSNHISVYG